MAKISVIIVNYKTPQLVIDCLASFLPELAEDASVVIADSDSQDSSVTDINDWLKSHDPTGRCRLITLSANGGFSAGYNAAIRVCRAEFYLLLNSDTVVRSGAIPQLLAAAEKHPQTGIFGPRLEWSDGTLQVSCFRDHSPASELIAAARTRQVTAILKQFDVPLPSAEIHPQWISFAAVLVRDEVLTSVGPLNEEFFLYFEDCEYCYRVRNAAWDILYVPSARIVHLHGQSSQVGNMINTTKRLPEYYYASRTLYFRLRYGVAGPTIANLSWCLGRLISKSRETFGKKKPHLPRMAWRDIWTNWSSPLSNSRN
jgi:N-acetylglucosaminyl-diphospho-decaprenol L-rhamnosyltransferase